MRLKTCLALALAGAVSFGSALATTLEQLGLADLTQQAEIAIVGKVISARTIQTDNGTATVSTLEVLDTAWNGANVGSTVEVLTPGGSITSGKFRVSESFASGPLLPKNLTSVFLLKSDPDSGKYVIVGFNQGRLQIVKSAEGNAVMMPGAKLMPLAAAMAEIKRVKLAPASDGLAR